MDVVRNDVENLVLKELGAANVKFPLFNSAHEGYAVILEEFEELKDEIDKMEKDMPVLWRAVKQNEAYDDIAKVFINNIKLRAVFAATEAIQVAAMCEKFKKSLGLDKDTKQSTADHDA